MKFRLLVVIAAIVMLMAPTQALAYDNNYPYRCDPGRTSNINFQKHLQWYMYPTYWDNLQDRAIVAHMWEYYPGHVELGGFSLANVVLQTQLSNGTELYAQIGWEEEHISSFLVTYHKINIAWTDASGQQSQQGITVNWQGEDPSIFEIRWENAPGNGWHTFHFDYNGVDIKDVVTNWTPHIASTLSEVKGNDTQAPGDSIMRVGYFAMRVSYHGSWHDFGATAGPHYIYNDNPYAGYTINPSYPDQFSQWDWGCPH